MLLPTVFSGGLFLFFPTTFALLLIIVPSAQGVSKFGSLRHRVGKSDRVVVEQNQGVPRPNLLFTKSLATKIIDVFAIGWELVVKYQIFNIGDAPAVNLAVYDIDFEVDGKFIAVLEKSNGTVGEGKQKDDHEAAGLIGEDGRFKQLPPTIGPGKNFTWELVVLPVASKFADRRYRFQEAKITYEKLSGDEGTPEIVGWSSLSHKEVKFLPQLEAQRRFRSMKSKMIDLILFLLMTIPTVLAPYTMWKRHSNKYDALQLFWNNHKASVKGLAKSQKVKNNKKIK